MTYPYKKGNWVGNIEAFEVCIGDAIHTIYPYTLGSVLDVDSESGDIRVEWLVSGDPYIPISDTNVLVTHICEMKPDQIERTYFL